MRVLRGMGLRCGRGQDTHSGSLGGLKLLDHVHSAHPTALCSTHNSHPTGISGLWGNPCTHHFRTDLKSPQSLLGSAISRGPRSLRKSIMSCWGSQRRPALQVCSLLGHTWRAYSTAAGIKIRNRDLFCPGHPHQWRLLVPAEYAELPHSQTEVGPICLCSAPTERNGFRSPCPGPARLIASKNLVPLLRFW